MANTYIVHSGIGVEGFPFDGEWESAGAGYASGTIGDLEHTGTITANNFNGTEILAIGVVTGSGYEGNSTPSPVFIVVMPAGQDQNLFTQVTVQLNVACSSPYTFFTANANLFTNNPASAPASANWVWEIPNASLLFVQNDDTIITMQGLPAPMTLDAEPESDSSIYLTWTDSQNTAVFYNLERDGTQIQQFANTFFAYTDTGLSASTSYSYSITGVDGSNNAVYLPADASATTEDPPVPVPVQFLAAFNGDQFFTANGDLNIGGELYTYSEGSLTPVTTYTDVTGTTANPNPITINIDGFLDTAIWSIPGTNTRVQVYDSVGNLLRDLDNIPGVPYIQDTNQVFVIDSIFATDTANAASANAVNWAYNVANAAGSVANTNANNIANVIANAVTFFANTITISSENQVIQVGNTINFNNTAFANIAVTPFGANSVNIAIFANGTTASNTTNSSVTIGGITFQWAFYSHTEAGETGPFTDDFPVAFSTACLGVQMTTVGGPGAASLAVGTFTRSAFTWYTGFGGADTTGQYVFAYGH
jgi:hypothetical protein